MSKCLISAAAIGQIPRDVVNRRVSTRRRTLKIRAEAKSDAKISQKAQAKKEFRNINKYFVPTEILNCFTSEIMQREGLMKKSPGFVGLKMNKLDPVRYEVESIWASIPEWEVWSSSPPARKSHLSPGIFQYIPKKGEGFPEDFTPFIDFKSAIVAKYK